MNATSAPSTLPDSANTNAGKDDTDRKTYAHSAVNGTTSPYPRRDRECPALVVATRTTRGEPITSRTVAGAVCDFRISGHRACDWF